IVIVGSIASEVALPRAEAYGASKAAVSYFARTLAVDLKKKGIQVVTVFPGFVETPLTDKNDFEMPMIISTRQASNSIR
ncbi:SDR family NAD(P)-dependent oxidoreductase, partial [Vibrio diabolicus]